MASNTPVDREQALQLQDEAIAIATELGMKPLLLRVLAKREICEAWGIVGSVADAATIWPDR